MTPGHISHDPGIDNLCLYPTNYKNNLNSLEVGLLVSMKVHGSPTHRGYVIWIYITSIAVHIQAEERPHLLG